VDVTLLDYGMGNLRSVQRALEAAGATVHRSPRVAHARVVLPGQGAFPQAVARLRETGAWDDLQAHLAADRPLLGICLGMQLLFDASEEHGATDGLGVVPGRVVHLSTRTPAPPTVPNMGWHCLDDGRWAYFAHSFGVPLPSPRPDWAAAAVHYGTEWVASVRRGPVHAHQFHPEKSGADGLRRLQEWLAC
jgi:imidazole glycerol phosphate synthase glutamine amidotransferase subunit